MANVCVQRNLITSHTDSQTSPVRTRRQKGGTPMKTQNVLICGAGAAGPALAYWLSRHGFRPTVVERAPALRDGGQAVDIRGAAIEVARRMGILAELRGARTGTRGMSYVSSAGRRV